MSDPKTKMKNWISELPMSKIRMWRDLALVLGLIALYALPLIRDWWVTR